MFSVNGVALDDPARGWILRAPSEPLVAISIERTNLTVAGRDGSVPLPGVAIAPTFPLMVQTPKGNLQDLRAVFRSSLLVLTETAAPELEAVVELVTLSPVPYGAADEIVDLVAVLRIPGVFWRDTEGDTSVPAAIGSGTVVVDVLPGLSAPVRDAVVRVKGGVTNLVVTDAGGSFFSYAATLPSTSYLRFDSESGQAWVTTTDTWTGGTEVTGLINTGPGAYFLELTPTFTDPSDRSVSLTVTSSARTGTPTIEVRGKRAYEV